MSHSAALSPASPPNDGSKRRARIVGVGLVLATCVAVSGCADNMRKQLGLIGDGPDEFEVLKRKPLNMPANLRTATLPEPSPGAPSLVDPRPTEDAQRALQGDTTSVREDPSAAEAAFLEAAGVADSSDAIRDQIAEDKSGRPEYILDSLLGRGDGSAAPLDPASEAERLARQAQETKNPGLEVPSADGAQTTGSE